MGSLLCSSSSVVLTAAVLVAAAVVPETGALVGAAAPWASGGHEIVCEIAYRRLSPAGRELVAAARAADPDPSPSFRESCVWADDARYENHRSTYEYHFVNVDEGAARIDLQRDCGAHDCVQIAVIRYATYLARAPRSGAERVRRANALKFLGHLVGDLHQPLHAGYREDRGGNSVIVDFFDEAEVNLHAVWDFHIPDRAGFHADPVATARRWNDEISAEQAEAWRDFDVFAWSEESYQLARTLGYGIPASGTISDEYFERAVAVVRERMKQAGVRLAFLIDRAATNSLAFPPTFRRP